MKCKMLRRKFRHARGGSAPRTLPRKVSRLECHCASPCVVHLLVLCISVCFGTPCVVHVAALCTWLCRKFSTSWGKGLRPQTHPKISSLECRCASPCVVHFPVLCISLCCTSPYVVHVQKIQFSLFRAIFFYFCLCPNVNEPQLRVRF